jgi:DNA-binding NarL/FixJ family response regulator
MADGVKEINVWIVEDDAVYRRNLQTSLELEDRLTVSRVFPSCIELFEALDAGTPPDVVLMDLGLPVISGIEGIRRLSHTAPGVAALVLTVFKDKKKVSDAMAAGAAGYLLKESSSREIACTLQEVYLAASS